MASPLFSDACKEDIAEMLNSGWSVEEVAEHLGVAANTVYQMKLDGEPICHREED